MATIKHISSKSSDYSAAESYLIFQHDEFRNIPVLDDQGKKVLRKEFLIQTVECGDEDYAMACVRANKKFGVNDKVEDIKSHHYIISFDPRDSIDNGLTMEKAQMLGIEFCRKHFPGHPAIVATHPDGHNASGNIHVHIVINSLRIREVERLPFMEKPCDWQAGRKHRCTAAMLRYLRSEVMEMCTGAGLYQIDLLNGSQEKITEREYWAQQRGQRRLDHENAELVSEGQQPKATKYETDKAILRKQIRAAMEKSSSLEEFAAVLMQDYGITLHESRGRFSYLTADRTKAITSRKLGEDFSKEHVLAVLAENARRQPDSIAELLKKHDRKMQNFGKSETLGTIIDIQQKLAEGKGAGYARWASVHNVKQLARSLYEESVRGIRSHEQLAEYIESVQSSRDEALQKVQALDSQILDINTLAKHIAAYQQYRDTAQKAKSAKNPAEFRKVHRRELENYSEAVSYFRDKGITKLPSLATLQSERESLISLKSEAYQKYRDDSSELHTLRLVQKNMQSIFSNDEKKHGQEVR